MKSESFTMMPEIEALSNPFPGLRPFEFDESHLFFGRDGQSEQLLRKLAVTRFVAVVGTSGSGKSSLVRAGLLPDIFGGFISSAGSHWRVAMMRPSNDPLGNLSQALASPSVFGSETEENAQLQATIIEATLRRGSLGLAEVVRQNRMPASENLLIVVDQFEELFRFARVSGDQQYQYEAASFVRLLLEATRQRESSIYVVLTMRSDFLGDCSLFWGLPEAVNEGQYLIPRLTRDQRSEAITGPIAVGGAEITGRLVNRLLNDMGDDADQLPILQHALMRAWDNWKKGGDETTPIDLVHYEAIGGMSEALSRHADEAYNELPDERSRLVAEKIFKGLTEKGADNREIRRPVVLSELCAVSGATQAEVISIIEVFRREGRTFLMPPEPVPLAEDSLIDISHESLIRNWARLKEWVDEEALSAQIYRRLAETAALYERGEAGLWRDPDLQIALNWRERNHPNQVWANRYHKGFDAAMKFLDASVARREAEALEAERQRQKELRRARLTAIIFALAFLFSLAALTYALVQRNRAEKALADAEQEKTRTANALMDTEKARARAVEQKIFADSETLRAEEKSKEATKEKENAEQQKKIAEQKTIEAQHALSRAEAQTKIAEENRALAERNRITAEEQRSLAVTEGEKSRQLLYAADLNLAQQAFEANNITQARNLLEAHQPLITSNGSLPLLNANIQGFEWYYLWNLYHRESGTLSGHKGSVEAVAFVNGNIIASGSRDGTVRLWNRNSNQAPTTINATDNGREVRAMTISPDGATLAVADSEAVVRLLKTDAPDGSSVTLKSPEDFRSFNEVSNITFSPDGKMLALGVGAREPTSRRRASEVLVWNTDSHQLIANLTKHASYINFLAFSPDGKLLASCGSDGKVILWDMVLRKYLKTLAEDNTPALTVAFSRDGKTLAAGFLSGTVKLWDRNADDFNLNHPATSAWEKSSVSALTFSPDSKFLAVGRATGTVELWTRPVANASYQQTVILKGHTDAVTDLAFAPNGDALASSSLDRTVKLWDTGPAVFRLFPLREQFTLSAVALSADGKMLADFGASNAVRICEIGTLQKCVRLSLPGWGTNSIALSPDGKILATDFSRDPTGFNFTLNLWDISSLTFSESMLNYSESPSSLNALHEVKRIRLDGHTDIINTIAFSPDGKMIATGSRDKSVRLWNVATHSQIKMYQFKDSIRSVAFSHDGKMLAAAGGDGAVTFWRDVNSNAEPITLKGFTAAVFSVAFSRDGKMLCAGGQEGTARLWRIDTRGEAVAEKETFAGHGGAIYAVAFSPDGKTLATGSEDKTVKLWSVASHKELITLAGHTRDVIGLAFEPNGKWLVSGSTDSTVRFWYAATEDEYKARLNK
jgi:WD40 repeat protein/energy-coupling factor transporter ATP-binding protein EcfA2